MASFILRKVDDRFWSKFRDRAQDEGRSLRWVILTMIQYYTANGLPKGADGHDGEPKDKGARR